MRCCFLELRTTVPDKVNMLIVIWSKFGYQDNMKTISSKDYIAKSLILLVHIFRNYSVENLS